MCCMSLCRPSAGQEPGSPTSVSFNVVMPYCLVYLQSNRKILLIRKSEGRSHAGELRGLGGKFEHGEDPVSAAIREFREESGLTLADPKMRGTFIWIDEAMCGIVHILTATRWTGALCESEEGEIQWHSIGSLATLDGLAKHQLLFLDTVLQDEERFYSGVAIFQKELTYVSAHATPVDITQFATACIS